MCSDSGKNSTPDKVFEALRTAGIDLRASETRGIGLFVVPAPEIGILEWRVVEVDNLGYEEAIKRGANCDSFQWIPLGLTTIVRDKSVTINSIADLESLRGLCDDSCRGGCPMGCVCFTGDVRCRKN